MLNKGKGDFLEDLGGDEFRGVRGYVEEYYPTAKSFVSCDAGIYAAYSVDAGFYDATKVFDRLKKAASSDVVTFTVASSPSGARFTLMYTNRDEVRAISTTDEVANVYLGLYLYALTKQGYKTIDGRLNLVEEKPKLLDCTLTEQQSKEDPLPCKHRR